MRDKRLEPGGGLPPFDLPVAGIRITDRRFLDFMDRRLFREEVLEFADGGFVQAPEIGFHGLGKRDPFPLPFENAGFRDGKEGFSRFCGENCRRLFLEKLRRGTAPHPGRTVARRRRRRGR